MTVAIFAGYFWPHKGGYESYIWELGQRLARRGHRVIVLTTGEREGRQKIAGMEVVRWSGWSILGDTFPVPKPSVWWRLPRYLSRQRLSVINTHTRFFPLSFLGAVLAKFWKIPLSHTEHGAGLVRHQSRLVAGIARLYDWTIGRFVLRAANTIVVLSPQGKDFARALSDRGAVILPNGVDTNFFHPRYLEKPHKKIVFVGRLIAAKGVQDLLHVWPAVGRGMELVIVGDGPYRQNLERSARQLTKVQFVGSKDRLAIRQLLSTANLVVNPSYSEGMPTSVLEALSMGLPVVATNVGGTPEISPYSNRLFLYSAGDFTALKNQIERARLAGRHQPSSFFRQRFDWESIAAQYDRLLRQIGRLPNRK